MPSRLIAIYLNDHLAGAISGLETARRCRSSNEGTELGTFLDELIAEIDQDRITLENVMDHLGISKDPVKRVAAWGMEKVGRLKLNGQIRGYSPLSRLIELEVLFLGVTGKLELWKVLEATIPERLPAFDLANLIERAEAQRSRIDEHRLEAAKRAFAEERVGVAPSEG